MSTARLAMTTIDCADPRQEAAFWSALLGWDIGAETDDYAMLVEGDSGGAHGASLSFNRVVDHQPPSWPDERGRKQFHLDLSVEDVAATEALALSLGATLADPQPGEAWRVLVDPAGHPFCLTQASAVL